MQAPPKHTNGACQGAAAENKRAEHLEDKLSNRGPQGGVGSWSDLDLLTSRLNTVADYEDHLRVRIRWAQLKLDLGIDDVDVEDLVSEVQDFKDVCAALSAPSDGRREAA